jgi:hypothetical protein
MIIKYMTFRSLLPVYTSVILIHRRKVNKDQIGWVGEEGG